MNRLELKLPPPLIALAIGLAMAGLAQVTPALPSLEAMRPWLPAILLGAGALIAIAAVMSFRRARTTIHPLSPQKTSTLVDSGLFRFSRNPMYLGMALVLLAWAVWLAAPATLIGPIAFIALITRVQIQPEERALLELFGEAYRDYCQRTRRWL